MGLPTGASLWKVDYEFGELQTNGTVDALKNSGNIARQTLTVPGTSFVQSYRYDAVQRLTEAVEKTGTTTNWSQEFGYDRYGNRTSFSQNIGGVTTNTAPAVNANTNRFTSTDFGYDANGNIVGDIDEVTNLPRQFIFNGDNKQTEVKRDGITIGRYYYDGEGKRVKKVTDTDTTVFVYSGGLLIAEYSTNVAPIEEAKVSYTTADHLGSPRVLTDKNGQVISRRDFMPFGEELYTGVGGRTGDTGLKYGALDDDVRQKFTGYQKDNETDLDFAEARMYTNNFGRFTAVDPIVEISPINPQTLNKYVYAINSPYRFVDRSGKWPTEIHNLIFLLSLPGLSKQQMQQMQDGSYAVDMPTTVLGYYANRHGMCKPSQGPFECAIGVITAPMPDAIKIGEVSGTLAKHYHFGRYSHTAHDMGSPAHAFQVYDDTNFLACALSLGTNLVACALYAKEATDHYEQEKVITQTQLNQLIQWQRNAYGDLFGNAALSKSLGIFANARFEFNGPIDGRTLPTVVIDNLGVVTVHADGREEYEDPLETKKKKK